MAAIEPVAESRREHGAEDQESDPPENAALDLSVVLPVFNEEGHLEEEIHRIREALDDSPYSFEIVVVDDGSTDGSGERLQGLQGIHLIQLPQNKGSGFARKVGTVAARGDIVVWTDVDMTYPNEEIPLLVKELDGYDQVVGARRSEQGTYKVFRISAKLAIRKLASYLTETPIPDLNSGMRAFRREVALQYLYLLPAGFSCVTTLTMAFLSNGYSVKYIPIDYHPRAGESKFHWWSDTRKYLLQVIRMSLLYSPLKVFMPLGSLLLVTGLTKLLFDVITKDFRVATNTLVIFVAALGVVLIALLSDLIVYLNRDRHFVRPAAVFDSSNGRSSPSDGP